MLGALLLANEATQYCLMVVSSANGGAGANGPLSTTLASSVVPATIHWATLVALTGIVRFAVNHAVPVQLDPSASIPSAF